MKRALLGFGLVLLTQVAPAQAEIAVLHNGMTLKVADWRMEGSLVFLSLQDGGEVGLPAAALRGFVPDEVLETLERELAPARQAGTGLEVLAREAARRHGLDPELVLAVVAVESGFRPEAVSPKGAQGLMQLMPATARSLGVGDPLDPEANLEGGARHLKSLVGLYGGDLRKALAAYNAGERAVERHGGVPPYRETRQYVQRVLSRYGKKP